MAKKKTKKVNVNSGKKTELTQEQNSILMGDPTPVEQEKEKEQEKPSETISEQKDIIPVAQEDVLIVEKRKKTIKKEPTQDVQSVQLKQFVFILQTKDGEIECKTMNTSEDAIVAYYKNSDSKLKRVCQKDGDFVFSRYVNTL